MKLIRILLLFSALIIAGCHCDKAALPQREKAYLPEVNEIVPVLFENDSVAVGYYLHDNEGKTDTAISVKYFPKSKTFKINYKPDSAEIEPRIIEKEIIKPVVKYEAYPTMSKFGLIFIGLAAGVLLLIILKIAK